MNTYQNLPIIPNAYADKYIAGSKLVPFILDGVQTAWDQVAANSNVTEVVRTSIEFEQLLGLQVPFTDYDPIMKDMEGRN